MVKNLPTVQETWVRFLGGEDPLEKEMATHSSILANGEFSMENPIDRAAWQATVHGVTKVRHNLATKPQGKTEKLSLINNVLVGQEKSRQSLK